MTFAPYQGHGVFKHQPSYKYFNKSFDDSTDALFLGLNEIHPHFLCEKQLKKDDQVFTKQNLIDPRNKQPVTEFFIDNTRQRRLKIFKSHCTSQLSKAQHFVCLRVLQALKNQDEVSEADLLLYRKLAKVREKEKLEFFKFVNEFSQSHRERIYAPINRLVTFYGFWYRSKAKLLINLNENMSYNTHTGLPHVTACGNSEQNVEIADVQVLGRKGFLAVWNEEETELKSLSKNIDTFSELCAKSAGKQEEQITAPSGAVQNLNEFHFCIPFDAVLFLMTAGDYIDLPSEILLDIKNDDGHEKLISFHTILPARNCGWHTNTQIVEEALQAFQSLAPQRKWLHFDQNSTEFILQSKEIKEVIAGPGSTDCPFKPQLFDDYLQNSPRVLDDSENKLKSCKTLVHWKLRHTCNAEEIQISTVLPQPPALDEDAKEFLGGFTIKLEYKPQFGCEVMTKYELLKEWFSLRLLAADKNETVLYRLRVSAANLETVLSERVMLSEIEHELSTVYSVNMPRLLSGLYEFLKMLTRIPTGKYMLRFNPKFRDKIMLCAPSKEITQNTIFLHSLLLAKPNNLVFMTQHNFLPISNDLCSAMHKHYKILPCAFFPLSQSTVDSTKERPRTNPKFKILSDRDFILSKLQKKSAIVSAKKEQIERKRKGTQKSRRRNRLKASKEMERKKQQDEEELQQEIELDKMLFLLQK